VLDVAEAAVRLGTKPSVLYKWRHRNEGPLSFKMGSKVCYRESAIEAYLDALVKLTGRGGELT
jgi:predicted DNA-binding transcriptional regulator AlpA